MSRKNSLALISKSWQLLSKREQNMVVLSTGTQVLVGFLDLAGIVILGLLGTMSFSSKTEVSIVGSKLGPILSIIEETTPNKSSQMLILALLGSSLLLIRTVVSIFLTKRTLKFYGLKSAELTTGIVLKLLNSPYLYLVQKNSQENLYSATRGIEILMMQVLANLTVLISDISLILVLGIGLFYIDFYSAVTTSLLFLAVGVVLTRLMNQKALDLGRSNADINVESNKRITEALNSYREIYVVNRQSYVAKSISELRYELANVISKLNFMPYLSKYVVESSVVLAALLLGGVQARISGSESGIAILTVFMASATRIVPAALRAQQSSVRIQEGLGAGHNVFSLITDLEKFEVKKSNSATIQFEHPGFKAQVRLCDVSFKYPGNTNPTIGRINLEILEGQTVAIVGKSGAGKSTLVDLILGVIKPDKGNVLISNQAPDLTIEQYPGAIGFVPQEVHLHDGSILENLVLGFNSDDVPMEMIREAVRKAGILSFIENLPNGFETQIGERGTKLSGGQRQRLGIAKALITNPTLLIMDEATSSLDAESENLIAMALEDLRGKCTVIIIAHRLSSIRKSDKIVYMNSGHIEYEGSFDEVRSKIRDFDLQAKLMGL
jgi:ABC-type multidrug transport system fused ATPase/permease subunit